eukprot:6213981-Pyramimonas_sp.AAC.2
MSGGEELRVVTFTPSGASVAAPLSFANGTFQVQSYGPGTVVRDSVYTGLPQTAGCKELNELFASGSTRGVVIPAALWGFPLC